MNSLPHGDCSFYYNPHYKFQCSSENKQCWKEKIPYNYHGEKPYMTILSNLARHYISLVPRKMCRYSSTVTLRFQNILDQVSVLPTIHKIVVPCERTPFIYTYVKAFLLCVSVSQRNILQRTSYWLRL